VVTAPDTGIEKGNILIVDDNPDVLLAADVVLKKQFQSIQTAPNPKGLEELLRNRNFDVVLLDMNFTPGATSGLEGFQCLNTIREIAPECKVILMTAYAGVELAIQAIKEGATDFVIKPWDNAKLLATVVAAMRHSKADRRVKVLESQQQRLTQLMGGDAGGIIGQSSALQDVLNQIAKVAPTDANILILGENGTGKELIARAIHRQSLRNKEVFISVDIGAITESLFESELFGHKKGAFTDAAEDRAGRFEVASGGTLFLDEIGNLNLQMQSKLLGALQNRQITRVGSNRAIDIDTRLISATNMPLHSMVSEGSFRQDLLYRINTVEIRIPPLSERSADISLLADHFMRMYARKYRKTDLEISEVAIRKLEDYPWPGNVRELQHAIERAVIMADDDVLEPDDFLLRRPVSTAAAYKSLNLQDIEKEAILQAIQKHNGNLSRAAQELGLARATLYRKMEKYGV
jgi:two-component system response regulator HydG